MTIYGRVDTYLHSEEHGDSSEYGQYVVGIRYKSNDEKSIHF